MQQQLVDVRAPEWRQIFESACDNSTGTFYETGFCSELRPGIERRYKLELHPDGRFEFQFSQAAHQPSTIVHDAERLIVMDPLEDTLVLDTRALQLSDLNQSSLERARQYLIEGLLVVPRGNPDLRKLTDRIEGILGEKTMDSLRQATIYQAIVY